MVLMSVALIAAAEGPHQSSFACGHRANDKDSRVAWIEVFYRGGERGRGGRGFHTVLLQDEAEGLSRNG